MSRTELPQNGTISIEWALGSDPDNAETYSWSVRCVPPIPDQLVSEILEEIARSTDFTDPVLSFEPLFVVRYHDFRKSQSGRAAFGCHPVIRADSHARGASVSRAPLSKEPFR